MVNSLCRDVNVLLDPRLNLVIVELLGKCHIVNARSAITFWRYKRVHCVTNVMLDEGRRCKQLVIQKPVMKRCTRVVLLACFVCANSGSDLVAKMSIRVTQENNWPCSRGLANLRRNCSPELFSSGETMSRVWCSSGDKQAFPMRQLDLDDQVGGLGFDHQNILLAY